MNDMTQYSREEIKRILQCSYYDRRTDYVWKYVVGENEENKKYSIEDLESFQAMHQMLQERNNSVDTFMDEWNNTSHPGLLSCRYNKRSGMLLLKARSFIMTYKSKQNEFKFVVYSKVAKSIDLEDRETRKRYRTGGLFPLAYLVELNEQLYSRYDEKKIVKEWRRSPQFAVDCEFCKSMIPFITADATTRIKRLGSFRRLNIILHGNDIVRIGICERYSLEEFMSIPYYPRDSWQEGITKAFAYLDELYELHAKEMREWSDEMMRIALGKIPFDINESRHKFHRYVGRESYSDIVIRTALGSPTYMIKNNPNIFFLTTCGPSYWTTRKLDANYQFDSFTLSTDNKSRTATLNIKEEIAEALQYPTVYKFVIKRKQKIDEDLLMAFDTTLQDSYIEYIAKKERQKKPQHAMLVEAVKGIVHQAAPLIAYSGPNENIRNSYRMDISVNDADKIVVKVQTPEDFHCETFSLEDWQPRFRIWWSQLLLRECKYAKQCALDPENNYPF